MHYTVRFVATPEEDTADRLLFSQLLEHILLNAINPGQTEERGGEKDKVIFISRVHQASLAM